jgi:hypothetical protein
MMSAGYYFDATQHEVVNITSLLAIAGIMLSKYSALYDIQSR